MNYLFDTMVEVPEIGLLRKLGYRVGKNGLGDAERRAILTTAFRFKIPLQQKPHPYDAQWGEPESPQRLGKIGNCVAQFCINMKRRKGQDTTEAIADYESDLAWLRETYHKPRGFEFPWPNTIA